MTTRTDPHSPSNFNPADYSPVLAYSFATTMDGWPIPAWNVNGPGSLSELRRSGVRFVEIHPGTNRCDVCGATFLHGEVWRHDPTGGHLTLGHECAAKYDLAADMLANARRGYDSWKRGWVARAMRRQATIRGAKSFGAQLREDADLRAAIRQNRRHGILRDMTAKGLRFGSLTDGQVRFAKKLAAELDAPKEVFDGTPVLGRATVEGEVLAVKEYDGVYGFSVKMLVKVTDAEGRAWKAWGTVPSAILGQGVRGARVRFTAKFEAGRDGDPHFARFSRPTKAEVLAAA